jgi:hypothetical protein
VTELEKTMRKTLRVDGLSPPENQNTKPNAAAITLSVKAPIRA